MEILNYLRQLENRSAFEENVLELYRAINSIGLIVPKINTDRKREVVIADAYADIKAKFNVETRIDTMITIMRLIVANMERVNKNRTLNKLGDYQYYVREDKIEINNDKGKTIITLDNFITEVPINEVEEEIDDGFLDSLKIMKVKIDNKNMYFKIGHIAGMSRGFKFQENSELGRAVVENHIMKFL
jgi:hypothetical protein